MSTTKQTKPHGPVTGQVTIPTPRCTPPRRCKTQKQNYTLPPPQHDRSPGRPSIHNGRAEESAHPLTYVHRDIGAILPFCDKLIEQRRCQISHGETTATKIIALLDRVRLCLKASVKSNSASPRANANGHHNPSYCHSSAATKNVVLLGFRHPSRA